MGDMFLQERLQKIISFPPSLDRESLNPVITEDPSILIHRRVKVPYILGYNSCEGSYLVDSTFGCMFI